ncbi:ATP-binding protein [Streptomyces turgidiscabies]|uniref:ATPase/histidine kinase/DNA gyrase B/HSP90 domain protein n=1 Tax=Streptomyces turgidiscabies (strain Car8) TaxID=698760 RepID=L7EYS1_STRT8|nr:MULTISPECIES: ATP-binding protein [Streptomyces]ELP63881.1 ATPase/histidine kinase/DNA gyrase B/HSP90 domain protein [Streptomyces turgidiscabies Car8]MDX3499612.1 ATP-binding protein [Streptomyces turgidiscabies]GAQ69642.1 serine-protein kinase RsbW [Streptomyces turgidiscabies]
MSIWWSLHLRREAASVPLARRLLLGTMETAGVDPDISYDLSVALTEACANAVEHGGDTGYGDSRGAYRVTAYLDGEKCRIEVTDSGPGFPAASAAPALQEAPRRPVPVAAVPYDAENGRGLSLIEELADHLTIGNKPGRGGAVVSFDKILKWQKDAPLMAV